MSDHPTVSVPRIDRDMAPVLMRKSTEGADVVIAVGSWDRTGTEASFPPSSESWTVDENWLVSLVVEAHGDISVAFDNAPLYIPRGDKLRLGPVRISPWPL